MQGVSPHRRRKYSQRVIREIQRGQRDQRGEGGCGEDRDPVIAEVEVGEAGNQSEVTRKEAGDPVITEIQCRQMKETAGLVPSAIEADLRDLHDVVPGEVESPERRSVTERSFRHAPDVVITQVQIVE